jgi:hypothetical protein
VFDVRLKLRGKNGGGLVLELNSEVLIANSEVFAGLICEYRKNLGSKCDGDGGGNLSRKMCRIEVPDVENLGIFRETIELMFEEDIAKRLLKVGAYRAIDILEVSFLLSVFFFFYDDDDDDYYYYYYYVFGLYFCVCLFMGFSGNVVLYCGYYFILFSEDFSWVYSLFDNCVQGEKIIMLLFQRQLILKTVR